MGSVTEFVGIFLNYHQPYMKCAQGIVGIIIKAWPEAHFLGLLVYPMEDVLFPQALL